MDPGHEARDDNDEFWSGGRNLIDVEEALGMLWLGVDVGGTFTDLVLFDRGSAASCRS